MKQPALGKKILELRKQKGFTQEELVGKCNINVRTIQRIESGNTTPRSYTIKAILTALGESYEIIEQDNRTLSFEAILGITSKNVKNVLKHSWIFGMLYFFLGFIGITSEYYRVEYHKMIFTPFVMFILKLATILTFYYFIRGFIALGKIYKNNLLTIISIISLGSFLMFSVIEIVTLFVNNEWIDFILLIKMMLFGLLMVFLGVGVLLLHNKLGVFSLITGGMEIVAGLALISLSDKLLISIIFPMQLLEILLIYFVYEEMDTKELVYS